MIEENDRKEYSVQYHGRGTTEEKSIHCTNKFTSLWLSPGSFEFLAVIALHSVHGL